MKILLAAALIIAIPLTSSAQKRVETVECLDINNKTVSFPPVNPGKKTVAMITFSDKASDEAKTWVDPLYQKFIAKSGMMDAMFDASLYVVSFVSGTELSLIKMNAAKIKDDTPAALINSVLYTTASTANVKTVMNVKNDKSVYILVLSADGSIIKQVSGAFSDDKMETLEEGF